GVHADRAAEGRAQAELARGGAQRPVEQRGAEAVEEAPVHRAVLDHAHGACIAARQDALRILRREALKTGRDLVERLVPGDSLEFSFSLLADATPRVEQAIGRVRALEVVRDFR